MIANMCYGTVLYLVLVGVAGGFPAAHTSEGNKHGHLALLASTYCYVLSQKKDIVQWQVSEMDVARVEPLSVKF